MQVPVKSFEERLQADLDKRTEIGEKLNSLIDDNGGERTFDLLKEADRRDFIKRAELLFELTEIDHVIIQSLFDELKEASQRQPVMDESLVRQINHWKAEAEKWKDALVSFRYQNRI